MGAQIQSVLFFLKKNRGRISGFFFFEYLDFKLASLSLPHYFQERVHSLPENSLSHILKL